MKIWVVKIGTSLLKGINNISTQQIIENYCTYISTCIKAGDRVILVSSGAVGLGCKQLGMIERPEEITSLQAAAAVGQGYLIGLYEKYMKEHGINVAQILLTRSDLSSRICYKNASMTLRKLLDWNILPVVNENDTISNEELKSGDNDTLSALVATAISADELILLTDIDRLYSTDPKTDLNAKPITDVHHPKEIRDIEISPRSGAWGTGGIKTKLDAARIATQCGIKVHLADGRDPRNLLSLFKGKRGGTVFHPHPEPFSSRKSWLAHAIEPLGSIQLDNGACHAILNHGASVLLVGITKIKGEFIANQPIKILNEQGNELARGISSLSSDALKRSLEIHSTRERSPVVIHRDVLVLTKDLSLS